MEHLELIFQSDVSVGFSELQKMLAPKEIGRNALPAWHSGHRVYVKNRRSWVRIPAI
jgi:hypothetical protein